MLRLISRITILLILQSFYACGLIEKAKGNNGVILLELPAADEAMITQTINILQRRLQLIDQPAAKLSREGKNLIRVEADLKDNRLQKTLTVKGELGFYELYSAGEIAVSFEMADNISKARFQKQEAGKRQKETAAQKKEMTPEEKLAASLKEYDSLGNKRVAVPQSLADFLAPPFSPAAVANAALKDTAAVNELLALPEIKALFPADLQWAWQVSDLFLKERKQASLYAMRIPAGGKPLLDNFGLSKVWMQFDEREKPSVGMKMHERAAITWKNMTKANVGKPIAMAVDGMVISAPNVNEPITGGDSRISGNFSMEEITSLIVLLSAAPLPAPLRIVRQAAFKQ
jgi:SecD/SecF fusion protein